LFGLIKDDNGLFGLNSLSSNKKIKVFLGGTCNNSLWRNEIISYLKQYDIDYFNPIVDDWTPESQKEEIKQRKNCDVVLYTITPLMTGVYSIAEVVDDSNKRPDGTILVLLKEDKKKFTDGQWKSLQMVGRMVKSNGGKVFFNLKSVVEYINKWKQ
jgi:hypothetical protein